MTRYILFYFALAIFSISWKTHTFSFNCKLLPDGKYRVEYTFNSGDKPSILAISKNRFTQCCSLGDTLRGDINWIYDCYLVLKYDGKMPDTSGDISKHLQRSFGGHCFEFKKAIGDSIFFRTTYRGNVHITINEGRFIRLK